MHKRLLKTLLTELRQARILKLSSIQPRRYSILRILPKVPDMERHYSNWRLKIKPPSHAEPAHAPDAGEKPP